MGFNRSTVTRYGNFIYNVNDRNIGTSIEIYGEYAEHEMEVLRQGIRDGAIVLDVGAHLGTHTLMFAKAVGPTGFVYAFEPQRIVFQTLCANVVINDLINVECVHAAVGETPGSVAIPDIDYNQPANYGMISATRYDTGRPVRRVTLNEYAELPRVDLVKIDVEGNELHVLIGARRLIDTFRPLIYVENDRIEKSEALIRYLQALNYRLYWHLPLLYNKYNFRGNPVDVTGGLFSVNMLCIPAEQPAEVNEFAEVRDPSMHPLKV